MFRNAVNLNGKKRCKNGQLFVTEKRELVTTRLVFNAAFNHVQMSRMMFAFIRISHKLRKPAPDK